MHRVDIGPLEVSANADDVADIAFLSEMKADFFTRKRTVIAD